MTKPTSTIELAHAYVAKHPTRQLFAVKPLAKYPPLMKDNLDGNASNDPAQLEAWHKKWPGCNWGLAHRKSNTIVIDVDVGGDKTGQETFDTLDLMYGFPETEITTTPSGGHHHVYEGPHIFALSVYGFGKNVDSPSYSLIPAC